MIGKKVFVTTSWDDGHIEDLKVALLLKRYNLRGTFYVAPENRELRAEDRLPERDVAELAGNFEIGGHTRTHPDLSRLTVADAEAEITSGREVLEGITGKKITAFAYPYGAYNGETPRVLDGLGFSYARTVEQFSCHVTDRLSAGTTVHCLSHHYNNRKAFNLLRAAGYNPVRGWQCLDWSRLAKTLFDKCLKSGGIYHLWGHSWEVDQNNDWGRLDSVLSYISNHEDIAYVTNGYLGSIK